MCHPPLTGAPVLLVWCLPPREGPCTNVRTARFPHPGVQCQSAMIANPTRLCCSVPPRALPRDIPKNKCFTSVAIFLNETINTNPRQGITRLVDR